MNRKALNLIIMGAPGGGKGTISKKLIKDFGFFHVSENFELNFILRRLTYIYLIKLGFHRRSST